MSIQYAWKLQIQVATVPVEDDEEEMDEGEQDDEAQDCQNTPVIKIAI